MMTKKAQATINAEDTPQGVSVVNGQTSTDVLNAQLSRLAYSVPAQPTKKRSLKKQGTKSNRTSRFWFSIEGDPSEVIAEAMAPKKLDHIDSEIESRLETYKSSSPREFQEHIASVREFFLTEIAPKTLTVSGGTSQAAEVLKRLLGTDIDGSTAQRFTQMVNRAVTLRMAEFIVTYFNLDKKYIDVLTGHSSAGGNNELKFILDHVDALSRLMKSEIKGLKAHNRKMMEDGKN